LRTTRTRKRGQDTHEKRKIRKQNGGRSSGRKRWKRGDEKENKKMDTRGADKSLAL
jgi:hypothetical protein